MALSFRTFLAFESTLVRASSRCSVETNSSFIVVGLALGGLEHLDQARGRAAAARRRRPWAKWPSSACDDLVELAAIDADLVEERPDDAVALAPAARPAGAAGRSAGCRGRRPAPARAGTASWALIVSLSKRNAMLIRSLSKNRRREVGPAAYAELVAKPQRDPQLAYILDLELGVDRVVARRRRLPPAPAVCRSRAPRRAGRWPAS